MTTGPELRFINAALRLAKQWAAHEGLMTLNSDEQRFLEAFKGLNSKGLPGHDPRRTDSRRSEARRTE
jgi:hypothetical protein